MTKREVRAHFKANPEFAQWVKGNPELLQRVKQEPSSVIGIYEGWKKTQSRKAGLKKIADHYRSIVDQVQELHTLLQRVDHIVNNVKTTAQTVEAIHEERLATQVAKTKQEHSKGKK